METICLSKGRPIDSGLINVKRRILLRRTNLDWFGLERVLRDHLIVFVDVDGRQWLRTEGVLGGEVSRASAFISVQKVHGSRNFFTIMLSAFEHTILIYIRSGIDSTFHLCPV